MLGVLTRVGQLQGGLLNCICGSLELWSIFFHAGALLLSRDVLEELIKGGLLLLQELFVPTGNITRGPGFTVSSQPRRDCVGCRKFDGKLTNLLISLC